MKGVVVHCSDKQTYSSSEGHSRARSQDHEQPGYGDDLHPGIYMITAPKCHYRPLGVSLLAACYGLLGLLLLLALPALLLSNQIAAPVASLGGLLTIGSFLVGVLVCGVLAHGLWTLNAHVRLALLLVSGVVMLGFAGELLTGNRLGVAIFGGALLQLVYLSYPEVRTEFHTS